MSKVLLALAVCAVAFTYYSRREQRTRVDSRLGEALGQWRQDMTGIEYSGGWSRLSRLYVARLQSKSGCSDLAKQEIIIDEDQLEAGPYSTAGTLYHELGHYLFKLEHGSCSLMRKNSWTEEEYRQNWSQFVEEYRTACEKQELEAKY